MAGSAKSKDDEAAKAAAAAKDDEAAKAKSEAKAAEGSDPEPAVKPKGKTTTCVCFAARPMTPGETIHRWGYPWTVGNDGKTLEGEIPKADVEGGHAAGRWRPKGAKASDDDLAYWRGQVREVTGQAPSQELTVEQLKAVIDAEMRRRAMPARADAVRG